MLQIQRVTSWHIRIEVGIFIIHFSFYVNPTLYQLPHQVITPLNLTVTSTFSVSAPYLLCLGTYFCVLQRAVEGSPFFEIYQICFVLRVRYDPVTEVTGKLTRFFRLYEIFNPLEARSRYWITGVSSRWASTAYI